MTEAIGLSSEKQKSYGWIAISLLLVWLWKYIEFSYTQVPDQVDGLIILVMSLLTNILLIIRSIRLNNKVNVLVFAFISLYVYELIYYFFLGYSIAFHSNFADYVYYYRTLLIFSLFLLLLLLVRVDPIRTKTLQTEYNPMLFWINFIIAILIMVFGKTGYKQMSPINEYFIIFFFVAYAFSPQKMFFKFLLFSLAIVYGAKNVLLGGRIEMLQVAILIFALFVKDRISNKQLFLLFISATIALSAYEGIRSSLRNDKETTSSAGTVKLTGEGKRISNQGDVFYASVRIVGMIEDGVLTAEDRMDSFFYFMISPFMKGSDLPDLRDLSTYKSFEYHTGGGGLLPIFLYAWLYFPGVLLIAFFVAYMFRNLMNGKYMFFYTYSLFVIATVPRWFAYYPTNLIKLCVIGAIYAQVCHLLHHKLLLKPIKFIDQKISK